MPEDEDKYGLVTNPQRYAELHDRAEALIANLVETYDARVEYLRPEEIPGSAGVDMVAGSRRVVPNDADCASIAFGFTAFPGIYLSCGRWHFGAFPNCGCDACDEEPDELADEMALFAQAVVSGGFSEELDGDTSLYSATVSKRSYNGGRRISESELPGSDDPRRYDWKTWPRR